MRPGQGARARGSLRPDSAAIPPEEVRPPNLRVSPTALAPLQIYEGAPSCCSPTLARKDLWCSAQRTPKAQARPSGSAWTSEAPPGGARGRNFTSWTPAANSFRIPALPRSLRPYPLPALEGVSQDLTASAALLAGGPDAASSSARLGLLGAWVQSRWTGF